MKDLRVVDLCPELASLAFLLLELALRSGLRSDITKTKRALVQRCGEWRGMRGCEVVSGIGEIYTQEQVVE